ncbi:MAG: cytochrome c, partial [Verrucomicrobiota bacterium]
FLLLFLTPCLASAEVTYHKDIAPMIYQNCTSCHRAGESGPFPLSNFEEVSRKAKTIERVIEDRYMPPWHASIDHLPFMDIRRLSDEEIATFAAWVEGGKVEGDSSTGPEIPDFPDGWQLGEPDLIVTMKEAFEVPADGPDIYRNFVLPLELPEDKWVKAVELRPSARSVLHHSLFFLDDSGTARSLDGEDGKPGFNGMGFRKSGSIGTYVPGATPRRLPGDLARPLPKGSDIVLSTHFHPSGKIEHEQTTLGIYFADAPPSRQLQEVQVPPAFGRGAGIDIPAGESNFVIEDTFTLPVDFEGISVGGHAHYICETMEMTATLPDGSVKTLLEIADWDLDWQDRYYFAEPVILPKGTILKTVISYDNSESNPDNPHSPPKRIKWGRESTDEMGSITLLGVPVEAEDITHLTRAARADQARVIAELGRELVDSRVASRLPQIVALLDKDGNGELHESELPQRMRGALLLRLDADGDKSLNPSEIQTLKDWLETLQANEEV